MVSTSFIFILRYIVYEITFEYITYIDSIIYPPSRIRIIFMQVLWRPARCARSENYCRFHTYYVQQDVCQIDWLEDRPFYRYMDR